MCCSTGVCGPEVDMRLVQFAADLQWLADQGVHVTRYNLAQDPRAFADNVTVRDLLVRWGSSCLPVLMHNDTTLARGRYPGREELLNKLGLAERTP
jgi:hypothetical protein